MKLNELSPAPGSVKESKRIGRGHGSGWGKTAGKGHKGQHARSGASIRPGFEGGQMPLQRRLPKRGFTTLNGHLFAEVRLSDLEKLPVDDIDVQVLKQAGVVGQQVRYAKVILSGSLSRKVVLNGISATAGAKAAIEAAGGSLNAASAS